MPNSLTSSQLASYKARPAPAPRYASIAGATSTTAPLTTEFFKLISSAHSPVRRYMINYVGHTGAATVGTVGNITTTKGDMSTTSIDVGAPATRLVVPYKLVQPTSASNVSILVANNNSNRTQPVYDEQRLTLQVASKGYSVADGKRPPLNDTATTPPHTERQASPTRLTVPYALEPVTRASNTSEDTATTPLDASRLSGSTLRLITPYSYTLTPLASRLSGSGRSTASMDALTPGPSSSSLGPRQTRYTSTTTTTHPSVTTTTTTTTTTTAMPAALITTRSGAMGARRPPSNSNNNNEQVANNNNNIYSTLILISDGQADEQVDLHRKGDILVKASARNGLAQHQRPSVQLQPQHQQQQHHHHHHHHHHNNNQQQQQQHYPQQPQYTIQYEQQQQPQQHVQPQQASNVIYMQPDNATTTQADDVDDRRAYNSTLMSVVAHQHKQNHIAHHAQHHHRRPPQHRPASTSATTTTLTLLTNTRKPVAIIKHSPPTPAPVTQLIVPENIKVPDLIMSDIMGDSGGGNSDYGITSAEPGQHVQLVTTTSSTAQPQQQQQQPGTVHAPQLVRLISKQKHKYDDNVTSPTLTVVDSDAIRLPPYATSVHNNKLIVAIRPGRPLRKSPSTTQFPYYNIVAGIKPPYLSSSQQQQQQPNVTVNFGNSGSSSANAFIGLIKPTKPPDGANASATVTTTTPFGAQNIKFPAAAANDAHVVHIPEHMNVSVPEHAHMTESNGVKVPDKIHVDTGETIPARPPADIVVLSDSQWVSKPHNVTLTTTDNIVRLTTTRKPARPSTTKRINILSANTTVVTTNPEQLHDVINNVITNSHKPSIVVHQGGGKPGLWASLSNLLNAGITTSAVALFTLIKTIFVALLVMFLPPIALTTAVMQAVSMG